MSPLPLHHGKLIVDEAKNVTEDDFRARHPGLALVLEPVDLTALEAVLHPGARIAWCEARSKREVRIGRDTSWADVALPLARISKQHLSLVALEGGSWGAKDHGSTNGSFLHGKRLVGGLVMPVKDGDRLVLGPAAIRPFFSPAALYRLLRSVPVQALNPKQETLHRLAAAFTSLGFVAEVSEKEGYLHVTAPTGKVRVRLDHGMYLVETGDNHTRRGALTVSDLNAEKKLRELILDALVFDQSQSWPPKRGAPSSDDTVSD